MQSVMTFKKKKKKKNDGKKLSLGTILSVFILIENLYMLKVCDKLNIKKKTST